MMTQQLEVSILCAPLAAIDRRALSQAWYSALRLARQPTEAIARAPSPAARSRNAAATPGACAARCQTANLALAPPARERHDTARRIDGGGASDRRRPRSPLARRIERTFLDPRAPVKRATFSIGKDGGRVHVMLQSNGTRIALLALCAPALRPLVVRALAEARFALAARGIALDLPALGETPCS